MAAATVVGAAPEGTFVYGVLPDGTKWSGILAVGEQKYFADVYRQDAASPAATMKEINDEMERISNAGGN